MPELDEEVEMATHTERIDNQDSERFRGNDLDKIRSVIRSDKLENSDRNTDIDLDDANDQKISKISKKKRNTGVLPYKN